MPVGHHLLLARLAIDADLLTLSHATLGRPIVADLLPLDSAVLRLHAIGTDLLPVRDPILPLHVLVAVCHTSLGPLSALRSRLVTLGYASALRPGLLAFGALRPRLMPLGALRMLRPLCGREPLRVLHARRLVSLALRARGMTAATATLYLSPLATATVLGDRRLAILTPTTVRPRTCRGCDR